MTVTARDYQATALNPPAPAPAAAPAEPSAPDPNRVGVVFVHGIGTQQPAETFLDWSAPIVRMLTAWRVEHGATPDPVVRSEFSFSGSSQPYLELAIPAVGEAAAASWVITEAWWAAQIRAPSLSDAAAYVRHGLPGILRGIRDGYKVRADLWSDRLDAELATAAADGTTDSAAQRELRDRRRWAWIDWLDGIQKWLTILAYIPALVLGSLLLAIYAPFRLIPIQAIRDAAVLRSADNFLTTWFGDLPDVLDDPVQAANVRARLAESIDRLVTRMGCGSIVLVAHSGGAIVSFTTLLDPAYHGLDVQRLVTIGQGLALGWRLHATGSPGRPPLPDRLTGDLVAARPTLQWTDVWASYDPAPAGPIVPPAGVTLKVDSRPVTNRMSILEDHGGYWDNDEGFLVPLVRHIDVPRGDAADSRFYRDSTERVVRIERRRQRVAVLALWRWIAVIGALVPIVGTTLGWALTGGTVGGPAGLGDRIAAWFATFPGHELITGPLAFLGGGGTFPGWFEPLGAWLLGTVAIAVVFLILGIAGVRLWSSWDERERAIARLERLAPVHRQDVAAVGALLVVTVGAVAKVLFALCWGGAP
ncbi:MAG TPA: hypothetical protein VNH13_10350 [Candidatus Acidoferrales bacterium]|nr:hypothetical protein [Candidatus Acidoferrales bacterium]